MGIPFQTLPDHPIPVEIVDQLEERNSVEETQVITVVEEGHFVSSFIVRMNNLHPLGYDEQQQQWERIGTFPKGKVVAAFQATVEWMTHENESVETPNYNLKDVEVLEDLGELLQSGWEEQTKK